MYSSETIILKLQFICVSIRTINKDDDVSLLLPIVHKCSQNIQVTITGALCC